MKLLTWNCNGALRKKFDSLKDFQADIIVIQECENPTSSKDNNYREWASNFLWTGDNQHGQLWQYLQIHKKKLDRAIIAGDFNSNVFWDKPRRHWNHSNVVWEFAELSIESVYHTFHKEEQGKETLPTFIFQKNVSKPYHIDYIFGSNELIKNVKTVLVGLPEHWIVMSDHMPVFCEI